MAIDLSKGATVELVKALSDDIRTGVEGTVHESAGAAVREQTDLITNDIIGDKVYSWEYGGIDLSGDSYNPNQAFSANFLHSIAECEEGDIFILTAEGGTTSRAYAFVDSENTIIDRSSGSIVTNNTNITAPANASKLVVNSRVNKKHRLIKGPIINIAQHVFSNKIAVEHISYYTKTLSDLIKYHFKKGTFLATTGNYSENNARCAFLWYLDIDNFSYISTDGYVKSNVFAYDVDKNYIGTTSWLNANTTINKNSIDGFFSNESVKYIRFAFKLTTERPIEDVDTFYNHITFGEYPLYADMIQNNKMAIQDNKIAIESIAPVNTNLLYYGEKINLKNSLNYKGYGTFPNNQDGCFINDILIRLNTDNTFTVYDMNARTTGNNTPVGTFALDGNVAPHCNSACFGVESKDNNPIPLLYTNAYNNTNLPKGTCYVYNITAENEQYSSSLVQTINIGFTDDEIWTDGNRDTRPYGNFCVDVDNAFLYVYTLLDTTNVTRFFKFNLPTLAQGNITLSKNDILNYWDCERFPYIQGNCYYNGKLYICSGMSPAHGYIHVVDLTRKQEISRIDFNEIGLSFEPELIDVYEGRLIAGGQRLYEFSF